MIIQETVVKSRHEFGLTDNSGIADLGLEMLKHLNNWNCARVIRKVQMYACLQVKLRVIDLKYISEEIQNVLSFGKQRAFTVRNEGYHEKQQLIIVIIFSHIVKLMQMLHLCQDYFEI